MPSRKSLVARSYFVLTVVSFLFSSCLSDPITGPEVRARLVLPPQRVMFSSPIASFVAPATGDMVIRWTRSPADTQLNFKGYYVHVWTSRTDTDHVLQSDTDAMLKFIDSAHVLRVAGRLDTSVTFRSLPLGQYSVFVWGEKATDTMGFSLDSTKLTFPFDPRPLQNPTNLRATSTSGNTVQLRWDQPPTSKSIGMFGYTVYYHDPNPAIRNDSGHFIAFVKAGDSANTCPVTIPGIQPLLRGAGERPYKLWVKAVRNDSAYFYGSDTNSIVWAGAEVSPEVSKFAFDTGAVVDSGIQRFRHALAMGQPSAGQLTWGIWDDSLGDNSAKVAIQINGSVVTLNTLNGAAFLSDGGIGRMDTAYNLASIFYSLPYNDPSQFTISNVVLSAQSSGTGVVLYLMFKDNAWSGQNEWARIFVARHKDGTFVDPAGGIDLQVSFQPGVTLDGSAHLPYY